MTIKNRSYAALCTLLACVAPTGCDLSPEDDEDGGQGDTDDDASDSDDPSDPSDPSDSSDPSDPTDPSGSDPDTGGPDSDSGSDTSTPGEALGDSVFVYIHDEGDNTDTVRAFDVATNESWLVEDFEGSTEIRSIAIHPDRTSLAVSAFYQLSDADESEGIWRVSPSGGAPENIMQAIPGDDGEFQSVANLVYSPDGAHVYFDLGTSYGGGTIARVSDGGGLPELFLDINNGCAVNSAPGFSPDGSMMLTQRDVCTDSMQQGLIAYDAPPSGTGQVLIVDSDQVGLPLVSPQWLADNSGVVLDTNLHLDQDGDGTYETDGAALLILNFADGQLYTLVPAIANTQIRSFAISPDETRIVLCLDGGSGENLVLVDLTGEAPTYLDLTSDGSSCYAAW